MKPQILKSDYGTPSFYCAIIKFSFYLLAYKTQGLPCQIVIN